MIGNIEGALSSRRKRADLIIDGHAAKSRIFFEGRRKVPAVFLQQIRGKMMYLVELKFSPAGTRKLDLIIYPPRGKSSAVVGFRKPGRMS